MDTKVKSGNELIAEFMGQHVTPVGLRRNVMQNSFFADDLKYDKSPDWIIPVVEKILSIDGVRFKLDGRKARIFYKRKTFRSHYVHIATSIYDVVVQFIHYYNEQQNRIKL